MTCAAEYRAWLDDRRFRLAILLVLDPSGGVAISEERGPGL